MIDLEDALAPVVEHAPTPPAVEQVVARGRARRRRRVATLAMTLLVVAAVAIGAVVTVANQGTPRVAGPPTELDTVRVTLLDGSQLTITGPSSLGLTDLQPGFNGALAPESDPQWGTKGHGFSVDRTPPTGLGAVISTYPTADGHELVVHAGQAGGVTGVVQYPGWWLSASWTDDTSARWGPFAAALDAKETADGFLVIEPADPAWRLSSADAPDVHLGGTAYGSGATFAFYPTSYPAGCPTPAGEQTTTAQGWPVDLENGAWWCDRVARTRVAVWNRDLVDIAIHGLRVSSADAEHAVDRVTTLDGSTYEISAPSTVLDQLTLQSTVSVAGVGTPNVLNETMNPLPVSATRATLPSGAGEPSFPTADGHRFSSYHLSTECDCDVLAAIYGEWLVEIQVQGSGGGPTMSDSDRAKVAAEFAAHETADLFLVIDRPRPAEGPFADVVLNGVDMYTSASGCAPPNAVDARTPQGFGVHVVGSGAHWCDTDANVSVDTLGPPWQPIVASFRVRRL